MAGAFSQVQLDWLQAALLSVKKESSLGPADATAHLMSPLFPPDSGADHLLSRTCGNGAQVCCHTGG